MNEFERRREAIGRVINGEPIQKVCADLQRSRSWYYKYRARYRLNGLGGLQDLRPGHPPPLRTSPSVRNLIVEIRDRLVRQAEEGTYHLGIGATAIVRELRMLGIDPPHPTTIYRILREEGRVPRSDRPQGWCPRPPAHWANDVHQLDIWPRVLEGGQSLFLIHLVDVATGFPCGMVADNKSTDTILGFLLDSWHILGIPKVLQVDNEMCFTGGRWADRLGRVVRLALLAGSEVWFNPLDMPECNGYVERFHGLCDQFFWARHRFSDIADVAQRYSAFLQEFREGHPIKRQENLTPIAARQALAGGEIRQMPDGVAWTPGRSLPLVDGRVHCVRRTDSRGRLSVLGREFLLGSEYRHTFIRATLEVALQRVTFYYQASEESKPEVVAWNDFPIAGPVDPWDPSLPEKYLL